MDIEESKILLKDFQKGKIEKDKLETYKGGYKLGYFYTVGIQEAIETVLNELENSISISKVEEAIEELNQEIENCERRQNEVIALGGDDLHIREEIWDLEDKIHSLKQILEGLDVLKELQK